MKILFDQGTPVPLRNFLPKHSIITAYELGWQTLENGNLIAAAEDEGFEAIITTDQNLKYQQNLADRTISILVLTSTSWPRIHENTAVIVDALDNIKPSSFIEVRIK
ncbi:MAG TPA: hypothetical protein PLR83_01430 [Pyrinomonadaceae bacterium]|nr:hypothetical protein [Pyrinomonadaceae bacterium]